MRAARIFTEDLNALGLIEHVHSLKVTLHGSLAATGMPLVNAPFPLALLRKFV